MEEVNAGRSDGNRGDSGGDCALGSVGSPSCPGGGGGASGGSNGGGGGGTVGGGGGGVGRGGTNGVVGNALRR